MTFIIASLLGAFFFAAAGCLGVLLGNVFADSITPLEDGPPQSRPPLAIIVGACAIIGGLLTPQVGAQTQVLVLTAIVCVALSAIWVTDARRGIVPDAFTLGPLAIMLMVALWQHQSATFVAAAVPFVPFAIAAALSKGRGMGWGDVKLVALGGAVLGAQMAIIAFAVACLAAVAVNYKRGRRNGAIAFAPYLTSVIGLSIPVGFWVARWHT
jgi:leader peptidase (prepilin peptidase)/N-methyltransferase